MESKGVDRCGATGEQHGYSEDELCQLIDSPP